MIRHFTIHLLPLSLPLLPHPPTHPTDPKALPVLRSAHSTLPSSRLSSTLLSHLLSLSLPEPISGLHLGNPPPEPPRPSSDHVLGRGRVAFLTVKPNSPGVFFVDPRNLKGKCWRVCRARISAVWQSACAPQKRGKHVCCIACGGVVWCGCCGDVPSRNSQHAHAAPIDARRSTNKTPHHTTLRHTFAPPNNTRTHTLCICTHCAPHTSYLSNLRVTFLMIRRSCPLQLWIHLLQSTDAMSGNRQIRRLLLDF